MAVIKAVLFALTDEMIFYNIMKIFFSREEK